MTYYDTLGRAPTYSNVLRRIATYCDVLRRQRGPGPMLTQVSEFAPPDANCRRLPRIQGP
eukprot:9279813-Alexandrium_andersonii.AAC.1